mmetsp:Transcript_16221/g.36486  ORF Transcript_16221/g.36486 Transcript_16221/m.36486 type:complete len:648 (-) Transcript_16221:99-2042(-)
MILNATHPEWRKRKFNFNRFMRQDQFSDDEGDEEMMLEKVKSCVSKDLLALRHYKIFADRKKNKSEIKRKESDAPRHADLLASRHHKIFDDKKMNGSRSEIKNNEIDGIEKIQDKKEQIPRCSEEDANSHINSSFSIDKLEKGFEKKRISENIEDVIGKQTGANTSECDEKNAKGNCRTVFSGGKKENCELTENKEYGGDKLTTKCNEEDAHISLTNFIFDSNNYNGSGFSVDLAESTEDISCSGLDKIISEDEESKYTFSSTELKYSINGIEIQDVSDKCTVKRKEEEVNSCLDKKMSHDEESLSFDEKYAFKSIEPKYSINGVDINDVDDKDAAGRKEEDMNNCIDNISSEVEPASNINLELTENIQDINLSDSKVIEQNVSAGILLEGLHDKMLKELHKIRVIELYRVQQLYREKFQDAPLSNSFCDSTFHLRLEDGNCINDDPIKFLLNDEIVAPGDKANNISTTGDKDQKTDSSRKEKIMQIRETDYVNGSQLQRLEKRAKTFSLQKSTEFSTQVDITRISYGGPLSIANPILRRTNTLKSNCSMPMPFSEDKFIFSEKNKNKMRLRSRSFSKSSSFRAPNLYEDEVLYRNENRRWKETGENFLEQSNYLAHVCSNEIDIDNRFCSDEINRWCKRHILKQLL